MTTTTKGIHHDWMADTEVRVHWKQTLDGIEVTEIYTAEEPSRPIRPHDEGAARAEFAKRIAALNGKASGGKGS